MLPDASWLMLSGGLALGASGAALGLAAHAAMLTAGLAMMRPITIATAAALGLAHPRPRERRAEAAEPPDAVDFPTVLPSISLIAQPVVSIADGRPAAAVALEPSFRTAHGDEVAAGAIDWQQIPSPLLARFDGTILARGHALACRLAEAERREMVMVSVAASSLTDRHVLHLLARALQPEEPTRSALLVLVRGGPEASQAILTLPSSWRARIGLHLSRPLLDEPGLRRCLDLPLGCLEVEAALLDDGAPGVDLTARLVSRVALRPVPVVVSGVSDEHVARRLRRCPSLFARGPWFGTPAALAA